MLLCLWHIRFVPMKKLILNKQELIKLWETKCSEANLDTILETSGSEEAPLYSIKIDADLSLLMFDEKIKVVFGGQIEYLSEDISQEEAVGLQTAFNSAEDIIERLNRDKIMSAGIKALERLLEN